MSSSLARALAICLALALPALGQEGQDGTKVQLTVSSEPAEASVFVRYVEGDGDSTETFVGTTPKDGGPLELNLERAGPAEVVIFKNGFVCKVETLELRSGGASRLEVRLAKDVDIPRSLTLKDSPTFVKDAQGFDELYMGVLFNVVRFYVEEKHPLVLIERSVTTLVGILNAVRDREKVLRRELAPDARQRYYGEELDLRDYPPLQWSRTKQDEGVRRYTLTAGEIAVTGTTDDSDIDSYLKMLHTVYAFVKHKWDSRKLLSDAVLTRCAIEGILDALGDEHSHFMTPEDVAKMSTENEGAFGGVGIVVSGRGGGLRVVSPMEGTPGEKAGILAGDRIVAIDGKPTDRLTMQEAVRMMRGPIGTKVELTLRRGERDVVVVIERASIKLKFTSRTMIGEDVGYLRVTSFMNEQLSQKVAAELGALLKEGAKGLIIDLRNNPGGLLTQAHRIGDMFVPSGKIVTTRTRLAEESRKLLADPKAPKLELPIAVIINGGSASASEILAGTLQEHGLATVVGTKSFGKGSVQRVLSLEPFGCALALTVATYHLPSGKTPHKQGITPDVVVELDEEELLKLAERSNYTKDKDLTEDRQIKAALDEVRKKLAAKTD